MDYRRALHYSVTKANLFVITEKLSLRKEWYENYAIVVVVVFFFFHALVLLQHQISCVFIFLKIMAGGAYYNDLLNEARLVDDLSIPII